METLTSLECMITLVALIIGALICGFAASQAGGSFFWGLLFGPVGIVVAAVIGQGNLTRTHIEKATAALTPKPEKRGSPLLRPKPSVAVNCPECNAVMADLPGPGTYACPACGVYVTVE